MKNSNSPDKIAVFEQFQFDAAIPKYQAIIEMIKQNIIAGRLTGMLPSSRQLAKLWSLHRNTVVKAMEELIWEGWLLNYPKKGLVVNSAMKTIVAQQYTSDQKQRFYLPKTHLHNFESFEQTDHQTILKEPKFKTTKNKTSIKNWEEQFCLWLSLKLQLKHPLSQIASVNSIFESNYILSRILLRTADQIVVSKACKRPLSQHLPNLDVHLISLPTSHQHLDIPSLIKLFEQHKSIKFLYLHYQLDKIVYHVSDWINLMEICYRYGVLIIENICIDRSNWTEKRHFSCKSIDYRHQVISVVHYHLKAATPLTFIAAHPEVLEAVNQYKINMHVQLTDERIGEALQPLWN